MKTIRLTVILEQLHETKANSCQRIFGVVGCITPIINYISNSIQKQKLEIAIVDSVDPTAIARVKCYNTNLFNLLVAGRGIIIRKYSALRQLLHCYHDINNHEISTL